ncbi:MAG: transporter [Candidatus Eisenbacteria bacterium]
MKRTRNRALSGVVAVACMALLAAETAHASLARNAAGAKNMGDKGRFTLDTAGQIETDADGRARKLETGLQYQVSNRLQLLAEGTLFEAQHPNVGRQVSGPGDTDVTASWLVSAAHDRRPSVVLGAKVKLPTANHEAIGTNRTDVSSLLVIGRETGELELAIEAEYAVFGQPGGEKLENQFLYTLTAEYGVNNFLAVYGEVFGNSAPTKSSTRTDAAKFGIELDVPLREWAAPYLSGEVDTEGLASVRAGIEWKW